jgi:tRNA (cmo5U34)-methyltransferase
MWNYGGPATQEFSMDQRSINAYDLPQRVASYDADMEIMHPNRRKMVEIALEILPFPRESALHALDLGIGTGYFTEQFLSRYPQSNVIAVDGAKAMIDLAKVRLGSKAAKVDFRVVDFRCLEQIGLREEQFDVVYSSYALHHLNRAEKRAVVAQTLMSLRPNGWFLNADIIVAESPQIEQRIQELRVKGIVERAAKEDARFQDPQTTRRFLEDLEKKDGDQPQTLLADLQVMHDAGVRDASVFWLEYREAVTGGQR